MVGLLRKGGQEEEVEIPGNRTHVDAMFQEMNRGNTKEEDEGEYDFMDLWTYMPPNNFTDLDSDT